MSFVGSAGFPGGIAPGAFPGGVGVVSELGRRHHVERAVDGAVTSEVEAVADLTPKPSLLQPAAGTATVAPQK